MSANNAQPGGSFAIQYTFLALCLLQQCGTGNWGVGFLPTNIYPYICYTNIYNHIVICVIYSPK